jgi:hypothetical protein
MMIKHNIEKAFDTVTWEFLLKVPEAKGFICKWQNWLSAMLSTTSTKILVNGKI